MKFSLRTLSAFIGLVGLLATAGFLAWENRALRTENQKLRLITGTMVVEDPAKLHVVPVDSNEEYWWKWKVYIPPNSKNPKLRVSSGILEPDVVPSSSGSIGLHRGETYDIEVKVRHGVDGVWQLWFSCGGASSWQILDWIDKNAERPNFTGSSSGKTGMLEERRMSLIQVVKSKDVTVVPIRIPTPGFSVWIDLDSK